eukprot:scaffold29530_cov42-Cyclotella_meneghiniana.AAC.2
MRQRSLQRQKGSSMSVWSGAVWRKERQQKLKNAVPQKLRVLDSTIGYGTSIDALFYRDARGIDAHHKAIENRML